MLFQLPSVKRVDKRLGFEELLFNTDRLCVKKLIIFPNASFSMHFHKDKQEVFYLIQGRIKIELIDTHNADVVKYILHPGESILINSLTPHKVTSLITDDSSIIIEASTHHEDSDSYRVLPGDNQK